MGKRSNRKNTRPGKEPLKSSQENPSPPSSSAQGNHPPPSSSIATTSRNQPPRPPTPSSPSPSPIQTQAPAAFDLHEVIKIPRERRTIRARNQVLKSPQRNPPPPSSSAATTSRNQPPSPSTPSSPSASPIQTQAPAAFDLHEVIKIPRARRTIRARNQVLNSSQRNPPPPSSAAAITSRHQPPSPPTPSSPSASPIQTQALAAFDLHDRNKEVIKIPRDKVTRSTAVPDDENPGTSAVREEKKKARSDVSLALALESIQSKTVRIGEGLGKVMGILGMQDPAAKLVEDYMSNDLSLEEVMEQIKASFILQRRSNLQTAIQEAGEALSDIRSGILTLEQGTGTLRLNLNRYDSTLNIVARVALGELSVGEAPEELKAIVKKRSGGAL